MIERYTLPEMGKLWSIENEWQTILDVEMAACDAMAELGMDFVGESDVAIDGEEFAELREAISKLKPEQQELLRKVFWEEIKQTDIAKDEGVKKASIESRLSTIYKKIRYYLTE